MADIVKLYYYKAIVVRVYDGDTITVDIDLGFKFLRQSMKIRLFGINTPEVRGKEREEGLISRDWLRDRILGKEVIIKTMKDKTGKYGRYLGIVYLDDININDELVANNLAEVNFY